MQHKFQEGKYTVLITASHHHCEENEVRADVEIWDSKTQELVRRLDCYAVGTEGVKVTLGTALEYGREKALKALPK